MAVGKISWPISTKESCWTWGSNLRPSEYQVHLTELPGPTLFIVYLLKVNILIWATAWQNQPNSLCAKRRLRLIRDFAVCMKKPWVLSYQLGAQQLGGYPVWSETSLGAQVILLVLSCCCSILCCLHLSHVMRKPVFAICKQQRRRTAWASAQSDQHRCYSLLR